MRNNSARGLTRPLQNQGRWQLYVFDVAMVAAVLVAKDGASQQGTTEHEEVLVHFDLHIVHLAYDIIERMASEARFGIHLTDHRQSCASRLHK